MPSFRTWPLLIFITCTHVCFAQVADEARLTNIEAKGNFEPLNDLGCVRPDKLRNTYTPADLYRSNAECIKLADYDSAVYSSALAGVYARYDTMRVADSTAHQAQSVLPMKYLASLAEEQKKAFTSRLSAVAGSAGKLAALCADIRKIGPPDYRPTYMIQHGMSAFLVGKTENSLVPNFDGAASWEKSLNSYLHCPMPKNS
jgi:hypothetical protein